MTTSCGPRGAQPMTIGTQTRRLSEEDRRAGYLTFSDQYLTDREALLRVLTRRNDANDSSIGGYVLDPSIPTDRTYEFQFDDLRQLDQTDSRTALLARGPHGGNGLQTIYFGNDSADSIAGTNRLLGDHLYGGGGTDVLSGKRRRRLRRGQWRHGHTLRRCRRRHASRWQRRRQY